MDVFSSLGAATAHADAAALPPGWSVIVEGNEYQLERAADGAARWALKGEVITDAMPAPTPSPAPAQAMRFNEDKPDLAYLLSFAGYDHGWAGDFADAVVLLGQWYRGELESPAAAVDAFADVCDDTWPEDLAAVSEFGERKYARGNYLLGRGWHDTCGSLLRHVRRVAVFGEEYDEDSGCAHDGHIMWNCLFLQHCVATEIGGDDRLRPPPATP